LTNAATALALGLAVIAATPALAKSRVTHPGHAARAQAVAPADGSMTSEREKALRECNETASRFGQYTWGVTQGYQMRNCMTERGQPE
jgi:hypothetical protein